MSGPLLHLIVPCQQGLISHNQPMKNSLLNNKKTLQFLTSSGLLAVLISCQHPVAKTLDVASEAKSSPAKNAPQFQFTLVPIDTEATIGQYKNTPIHWGGFSSLVKDPSEPDTFWTLTDRGPNGEPTISEIKGKKAEAREFLMPNFNPKILKLKIAANGTAQIIQELAIKSQTGQFATGLPQWSQKEGGPDETAKDPNGKVLNDSKLGFDSEGLAIDNHGMFWASEEYRPSLIQMNQNGEIVQVFIPQESLPEKLYKKNNQKKPHFKMALPGDYRLRKSNRGFEGLCFARGHLFAALQSPLEMPGMTNRSVIRILEFDPQNQRSIGEFLIPVPIVNGQKLDKLGDLTFSEVENRFYVVLQNSKTGAEGIHNVYSFQLAQAIGAMTPELTSLKDLEKKGFLPELKLQAELTKLGFDFEKIEGLAVDNSGNIYVNNDNDFGLQTDSHHQIQILPEKKSFLGVLKKLKD